MRRIKLLKLMQSRGFRHVRHVSSASFSEGVGLELQNYGLGDTFARGATPKEYSVQGSGWLLGTTVTATDSSARFTIIEKASELTEFSNSYRVDSVEQATMYAPDPTGYALRYLRPNHTSTAGVYIVQVFGGYAHGSTLPIIELSKIQLSLDPDSTQTSCSLVLQAYGIEIKDAEKFIQSLRVIEGTRNMSIDLKDLSEIWKKKVKLP
jgi:hypothetical protein